MISEEPPPPPPPPGFGGQYPPAPYLPPPQYPGTYYPVPLYAGPAPGIGYAGFWIRFVAILIDEIILGVPLLIIFFATQGLAISNYSSCVQSGGIANVCSTTYLGSIAIFELVALAASLAYSVVLWSQLGGTLGQRMLGLRVVDAATGRNIGIGRAIGRFAGFVISSAALDIGLIWAAFDPRKQGWHDKMASTFVVRKV
jgi:uncharacterized RDD family membrane protein YckC